MASIVELADFKAYIRNEGAGLEDETLQGYLDAATTGLGNACGRQWVIYPGTGATARTFNSAYALNELVIDDCTTITSVTENGVARVAGTDYEAYPLNNRSASGEIVPYNRLVKPYTNWYTTTGFATVTVTATWGWVAIPYHITQACLILGKELCNNQDVRLGLQAIVDGVGIGMRTNPIVRAAINAYPHPNSIGVG